MFQRVTKYFAPGEVHYGWDDEADYLHILQIKKKSQVNHKCFQVWVSHEAKISIRYTSVIYAFMNCWISAPLHVSAFVFCSKYFYNSALVKDVVEVRWKICPSPVCFPRHQLGRCPIIGVIKNVKCWLFHAMISHTLYMLRFPITIWWNTVQVLKATSQMTYFKSFYQIHLVKCACIITLYIGVPTKSARSFQTWQCAHSEVWRLPLHLAELINEWKT